MHLYDIKNRPIRQPAKEKTAAAVPARRWWRNKNDINKYLTFLPIKIHPSA